MFFLCTKEKKCFRAFSPFTFLSLLNFFIFSVLATVVSSAPNTSVWFFLCYFYKTALHLCKCTAGFYCPFLTLLHIGITQCLSTCNAASFSDAQVTSGLGNITFSTSELSQFNWPQLGFDLADQTYWSTKIEPQLWRDLMSICNIGLQRQTS